MAQRDTRLFSTPRSNCCPFDEDGYSLIGDAGCFFDSEDPSKGISCDGRVAENFKLMSGTWVRVGLLRVAVLAATAPTLQFALVTGHDREYVGLLGWSNISACKKLFEDLEAEPSAEAISQHPGVADYLRQALTRFNTEQQGSSNRIARVMLMCVPPDSDANEITDGGYINQRAVLQRRKELVEKLYADQPDPEVIVL